jgi:hypothetical protein
MVAQSNISIPSIPVPNLSGIGPSVVTTPNLSLPSNPLSGLSGLTAGFQDTVGNKGFWVRMGAVAGGVALIWVGILFVIASNKDVQTAAIGAAKTAAVA